MKFVPSSGQDVHISLTTGHTAVVTAEGTELDPMFHKEAIARGCLPAGMKDVTIVPEQEQFKRDDVIRAAMNAMLDGNDSNDFTANGKPDLRKLNARVGFQVSREEADRLFAELTEAK